MHTIHIVVYIADKNSLCKYLDKQMSAGDNTSNIVGSRKKFTKYAALQYSIETNEYFHRYSNETNLESFLKTQVDFIVFFKYKFYSFWFASIQLALS